MAAIWSGVADMPAMAMAGSQGIIWIMPNVIRLTINRIGNAPISLRARMPPIGGGSVREPDVGHAGNTEWHETLDVGSDRLDFGEGPERQSVDTLQHQLLHAREGLLAPFGGRQRVHVVPRGEDVGVVLA